MSMSVSMSLGAGALGRWDFVPLSGNGKQECGTGKWGWEKQGRYGGVACVEVRPSHVVAEQNRTEQSGAEGTWSAVVNNGMNE